jgi:hypothetical protein
VYIEGLTEHAGAYVFYVFGPKAGNSEPDWSRIDVGQPIEAEEAGVRIRPPASTGVLSKLGVVAVARELADKTPGGDPSWFKGQPARVLLVKGFIEVVPLRQSRGKPVLRYRLEKNGDTFSLTLLNPERLTREREGEAEPVPLATTENAAGAALAWVGLTAATAMVLAAAVVWWLRGAN